MQFLVVAIRPLRVEELAEALAVYFDNARGVPQLKSYSRRDSREDQERAILAACSSLITIIGTGDSRVVQFSHYSIKEYLTSERLANSWEDAISYYHIALETAHTILAQACVSVLLQLPDRDEEDVVENNAPLAKYAAEYWVRHAQFEDVASRIKGMEYLFDSDKPYFVAWLLLHDIDFHSYNTVFPTIAFRWRSVEPAPLYYAALCGFRNLVEQLIVKYPQQVNTISGRFGTPAVAALAGGHYELAKVLHRNGSSVDPLDEDGESPLYCAVYINNLKMVQVLLDYGVDVNFQNKRGETPLAFAAYGNFDDVRVVRLLLDHGADPNAQARRFGRRSPLHRASEYGRIEIARLLLERGASLEVQDEEGKTPLDIASEQRRVEMIKFLLEYRAIPSERTLY